MRFSTIRMRLTLWYGGVMAVTLLALGLTLYFFMRHALAKGLAEAHPDYFEHELDELETILWSLLPVGLVLATLGGYWLAGRALRPVDRITETARRITADNLQERIAVANPQDELGRLAETLNSMIARLEASFESMRQFTADASHELRTPLTAVRTEVEIALRNARSSEDYQHVLSSTLEEVERMTRLADSLLLLTRQEARPGDGSFRTLRLDDVVQGVAEHMQAVAEQAGVRLTVGTLPSMLVRGDADELRQVCFNLLDNAVKYNRSGGSIHVTGSTKDEVVILEIADTGMGIPPAEIAHVFDRFYRVDKSRSRQLGGAGLGLSIAKALIEQHGGRIEAESTLGQGATFRVILPLASRA